MSTKRYFASVLAGLICASALIPGAAGAQSQPIDVAWAKKVFADAKAASDKDAGRLWGERLYGKILLVDPQTGFTVSNEPDAQGVLHPSDGVYVGKMPKDAIISNAPIEWEGARWTMLMSPTIPDDRIDRGITFAHEMFHRIQPRVAPHGGGCAVPPSRHGGWARVDTARMGGALAAAPHRNGIGADHGDPRRPRLSRPSPSAFSQMRRRPKPARRSPRACLSIPAS